MTTAGPLVRFDDSLPALLETVERHLGPESIRAGVVLRDATGRLSFFNRNEVSDAVRVSVSDALCRALGSYAYFGRVFATPADAGAARILDDPSALPVVDEGVERCRLIDRRIIGSDWLADPIDEESQPPRIVFASVKGGVGRSTAIAVLAADMGRRGQNVLVVDLDLEAPGIGHALLDEDRLPQYGSVDYLIENGISGVSEADLAEFIGTSQLTQGVGLVEVMPAAGKRSQENPENFMAKLARGMLEDFPKEGEPISLRDQIKAMLEKLTMRKAYDVVLIDARAGMTELAAGPIIGLGATILLFGVAQRQTIEGYRSLFVSLSLLANRRPEALWRRRIKMVYAKAPLDENTGRRFVDELWDLFSTYLYDKSEKTDDLEIFNFAPDDPDAPHFPLMIPFNQGFNNWDPAQNPNDLTASFYESTFRPFLDGVDDLVASRTTQDRDGANGSS
jgi:hypothetical protein